MINYTINLGYEGIYAIVNHPMLIIFQRSGWQVSIVEKGISEKNKNIYLIYMPVDKHNQLILIGRANKKSTLLSEILNSWALLFSARENRSNKLQLDPKPYSMFGIGNP